VRCLATLWMNPGIRIVGQISTDIQRGSFSNIQGDLIIPILLYKPKFPCRQSNFSNKIIQIDTRFYFFLFENFFQNSLRHSQLHFRLNIFSLEQAFDSLLDAGFYLAGCCGTGTSNSVQGTFSSPYLSHVQKTNGFFYTFHFKLYWLLRCYEN